MRKKIGTISSLFLPEGPIAHALIQFAFREMAKGAAEITNSELKDIFKNPPDLPNTAYIMLGVMNGLVTVEIAKKTQAKQIKPTDPKFILSTLKTYAIDFSDFSVWSSAY